VIVELFALLGLVFVLGVCVGIGFGIKVARYE
jgi:uncharacterized membrane protein